MPIAARIVLGGFGIANHEFLDRVTHRKSGRQPTRLFSPARPGFRRLVRVSVFWKYLRILARLSSSQLLIRQIWLGLFLALKLRQSLFEFALFGRQPDGQDPADLLMQPPHLVNRHGVKTWLLAHPSAFRHSRFGKPTI